MTSTDDRTRHANEPTVTGAPPPDAAPLAPGTDPGPAHHVVLAWGLGDPTAPAPLIELDPGDLMLWTADPASEGTFEIDVLGAFPGGAVVITSARGVGVEGAAAASAPAAPSRLALWHVNRNARPQTHQYVARVFSPGHIVPDRMLNGNVVIRPNKELPIPPPPRP